VAVQGMAVSWMVVGRETLLIVYDTNQASVFAAFDVAVAVAKQ